MNLFWVRNNKFKKYKNNNIEYYIYYKMSNDINETYLNQLFENFQQERTKLLLAYKNDKELNHKNIDSKLSSVERITKELIKYRNQLIKEKLKSIA